MVGRCPASAAPVSQFELGEQQRADVHERKYLAVDLSHVEQVQIVLDLVLVELQPDFSRRVPHCLTALCRTAAGPGAAYGTRHDFRLSLED